MTDTTLDGRDDKSKWQPEPLKEDGIYFWPIRPRTSLQWLKGYFFSPISLFHTALPLLTWFYLTPDLASMKTFELDWIVIIFIRNVVLLTLLNSIIHYRLYIRQAQGTQYKYNPKWPERNQAGFLFRFQTWDNMFWGIVSGCSIWTGYEVVSYWMFANGYMLFPVEWFDSPIYFVLLYLAIPHLRAHHFYFTHRLTHWKPLYKAAHYLHHKNTNTGPWSGLSMHPIEHLIYFSGAILHWIIPSHPLHVLSHLQHTGMAPVWGHSGFEKLILKKTEIKFSDNFHDLHHRYFECNYGGPETPWDRWFGNYHDGTEEAHKLMKDRLKMMRS